MGPKDTLFYLRNHAMGLSTVLENLHDEEWLWGDEFGSIAMTLIVSGLWKR
jgi:hypothetical protein